MKIAPFETEHFFARYEFSTPYQLCNSDCESVSIAELLSMAGDSLEQLGKERLVYTESSGHPALRQSIASLYRGIDPDQVLVLGTPVEGIYLAARALLEPGDEVIVVTPAYDALINMFEHVVGTDNVKRWVFEAVENRWQLDLEQLRNLVCDRTKMLAINFPHNPTGYLPSQDFLDQLVSIVEQRDLWLFSDEMYFGLVHPGTKPVASIADLTEKSIVLSGLSKTHGLPGLRCGWLVIRDADMRNRMTNWKFYTSICAPVPSEYLAIAAIRVADRLRDRNLRRIEQNLVLADAFFSRWPNTFTWYRPYAGSTALVAYHVPSVEAVAERLAEEQGVLIHPAKTLGSDDQHMRIGLGRDAFGEALERFEDWLARQPSRT